MRPQNRIPPLSFFIFPQHQSCLIVRKNDKDKNAASHVLSRDFYGSHLSYRIKIVRLRLLHVTIDFLWTVSLPRLIHLYILQLKIL